LGFSCQRLEKNLNSAKKKKKSDAQRKNNRARANGTFLCSWRALVRSNLILTKKLRLGEGPDRPEKYLCAQGQTAHAPLNRKRKKQCTPREKVVAGQNRGTRTESTRSRIGGIQKKKQGGGKKRETKHPAVNLPCSAVSIGS